jgi:DNA-binding MarR family transcriptional regulator
MTSRRTRLLADLEATLRKVGAQSVLLSDTVARLVGITPTDLECLDLLALAGPTTAGHLATHTGLTTGAMTAVIDRLEHAGFVRRTRDRQDRRVVLVEARPGAIERIAPLYGRLIEANARLNARYSDRQLGVVVKYLTEAVALAATHVTWLQTERPLRREPAVRARRAVRHPVAVPAAVRELPAGRTGSSPRSS